tara:strand:+ start:315 stop:506 length:192 start_codon:yes stop_codon:yes gene_type:complete
MKFILVYIVISAQGPTAINAYGSETYDDIFQCFLAREELSNTVGNGNGNFKPNTQAICVVTDK